jgi:hypothetical protein
MRQGETISLKSRTCDFFGEYLPLIDDMAMTLTEAMGGQESETAIVEVMQAHWQAVRQDAKYRELVAAVDAEDLGDLANGQGSPNGNPHFQPYSLADLALT